MRDRGRGANLSHDMTQAYVPPLIRRNTLLLAATQSFVGTGTQLVPTLGAIMIERLLGSVALAGLGTSLQYLARMLIAYPIGWVMDEYGRKAGLLFGLLLSLMGAVCVGLSMVWISFPLFLVGLLLFGLGVGAGQQLRTAAADMYPTQRRAEGLGYVLTGSVLGALGALLLINAAQQTAPVAQLDPVALAWLLMPAVLLPSMLLVFLIYPDPKEIAANLDRFYPGYHLADHQPELASGVGLHAWLRQYPLRVAALATFAAHGVMAMMMALTPLEMAHRGYLLTLISAAVTVHVIGMFGLSLPLGRLADRVGRRNVIVVGLATEAVGAFLVALSVEYWGATSGLALVGIGWSCVNVAVTALLADNVAAVERGRAVGVLDSFGGLASIIMPLAGSALLQAVNFSILAILALALLIGPALLAMRLAEPSPSRAASVQAESA